MRLLNYIHTQISCRPIDQPSSVFTSKSVTGILLLFDQHQQIS